MQSEQDVKLTITMDGGVGEPPYRLVKIHNQPARPTLDLLGKTIRVGDRLTEKEVESLCQDFNVAITI